MSTRQRVIPAGIAAQATQLEFDAADKASVVVCAFGLAGSETCSVFVRDEVGAVWRPVYNSAGVAMTLTATSPDAVLEGGPRYGFTKSATVGAAGLDVYPRRLS